MFGDSSVRGLIVEHLLRKPDQTAEELMASTAASKSAVYKELALLVEQGVVFKHGPEYRVHLSNVIEFINLAQDVKKTYLESADFLPELPEEGGKCRWRISNLYRMNDLYTNVVLSILKKTGSKTLLSWNPHPWFHLAQTKQENQFFESLRAMKVRMYKMVGGDTPLDHYSKQFWPKDCVTYSFAPGPYQAQRSLYFTIAAPYMITLEQTPKLTRQIEELYQETALLSQKNLRLEQQIQALDPGRFIQLFDQKTPSVLTLWRDKRKCEKRLKEYQDFFGFK